MAKSLAIRANCPKTSARLTDREHQIVYVKTDLLKVAGRMPGGVAI